MNNKKNFLEKWGALFVLAIATFILVVDTTMMNVSISALVKDLNTDMQKIQIAITIYSLIIASFIITGAKLGDIYGKKKAFLIGAIIYGVGTLTAALSPNVGILILGWSIIEGIGAAIMLPISISLITDMYHGEKRAISLAILAGIGAAASAVGPILGGAFTTYLSWRWAFGMEVVFVILILLFNGYLQPPIKKLKKVKFDYLGVIYSVLALCSIVLSIITASTLGIIEPKKELFISGIKLEPFGLSIVPFIFIFGVMMLIIFILHEYKLNKKDSDALIKVRIFKNRDFVSGLSVAMIEMIILAGFLFITPVFLQKVVGYSAMETGIALMPMSLAIFVFSVLSPKLAKKIMPKYMIYIGIVLMILGLFLFQQNIDINMTTKQLIVPFFIFGMGAGLIIAQVTNLTLSSLSDSENSEGSAVFNTLKSLGTSLGTAILGSLLITFLSLNLTANIQQNIVLDNDSKDQIILAMDSNIKNINKEKAQELAETFTHDEADQMKIIIKKSVIDSMKRTLGIVIIFGWFCLFASFYLPKKVKTDDLMPSI